VERRVGGPVWGKIIGVVAGFAVGGPFGAVVGAALGHAADSGGLNWGGFGRLGASLPGGAKLAAMLDKREQFFTVAVVVLAAKLAKCDGPVNRAEIDAFKRCFRIAPEASGDIARLFDRARTDAAGYESYARQLGAMFADTRGALEEVLGALFLIARADKPITQGEYTFLSRVHAAFGLDQTSWERATGSRARGGAATEQDDPYAVLGLTRDATDEKVRATWRALMRENHPDSLASRGVPAEFIARASDKVARINAAWDRIKRERGL
jgi:DnaJ like chaperone protein